MNATPMDGATTLCEAFQAAVAQRGTAPAIRTADGAIQYSWQQYGERVDRIAGGLARLGVSAGDCVAMMLRNSPECLMVDTAALHLGAAPFSVYNTSAPAQITHMLENAAARVVVTETAFLDRVLAARTPEVEHIVVVDGDGAQHTTLAGLEALAPDFEVAAAAADAVTPDSVAVLIYTSGTTGPPKGVQLTHTSLLFGARVGNEMLPGLNPDGRLVSYLPFAHIADRWFSHYLHICHGVLVTTVPDPGQIMSALPTARPTVWLGVPRIWEKLMAALVARGIENPSGISGEQRAELRAQLGFGDAQTLVSGAAPISIEVLEYFAELDIQILEGWAMSETGCIGAINRPSAFRAATVGQAAPGVELRLADDRELLIRGPNVMVGYRNDPEQTAEVLSPDGWLSTGDIAEIDDDGFVKIVDRKKELIINAAGKNMSPANIEQRLKASSPLIGQACAIGDGRPYNTALLVLDPEGAATVADDALDAAITEAVAAANEQLSRVEQIKRWTVVRDEWLPGGDELTPTMKLKRRPIAEKYATEIEVMYAPRESNA